LVSVHSTPLTFCERWQKIERTIQFFCFVFLNRILCAQRRLRLIWPQKTSTGVLRK
jgi:hypothetical protein